ncbi:MAG: hypothetical protein ABIE36_00470 [Candidatus Diapherotrites archaeon]
MARKTGEFNFGYLFVVALLFASLFFLTPSFTANTIEDISNKGSSLLSIILFVAGIGTFVFFRKRRKF